MTSFDRRFKANANHHHVDDLSSRHLFLLTSVINMSSEEPEHTELPPLPDPPMPPAEWIAQLHRVQEDAKLKAKGKERKRCCVKGCNNHANLQRVPPLPKELEVGVTKDRQITQAKRILKRQAFLERLGRPRDDKTKDLRFCGNHKMETEKFTINVSIKDKTGLETDVITVPLEFSVPVNVTEKPAVQGKRKRCCVKGCNNHMALQRVPPQPKDLPAGSSKSRQITRAKKVLKRNEFMKRLGYEESEFTKHPDLRFCPNHRMEMKDWTFPVSIKDENGIETECVESTAQFAVPVPFDKKESADEPVADMNGAVAMDMAAMDSEEPSIPTYDDTNTVDI